MNLTLKFDVYLITDEEKKGEKNIEQLGWLYMNDGYKYTSYKKNVTKIIF